MRLKEIWGQLPIFEHPLQTEAMAGGLILEYGVRSAIRHAKQQIREDGAKRPFWEEVLRLLNEVVE